VTGAFVQAYEPIRIYLYDPSPYPREVLNPLARVLLFDDPRYCEGRFLFERVTDQEAADLFLFPCDLNYFERREELILAHLPHYERAGDRHLFFDHRDTPEVFPLPDSFCLKVSLHRRQISARVVCIPYMEMVDNFFAYLHRDWRIEYLLSFIGERSELREILTAQIARRIQPSYFHLQDTFFHRGYLQYRGEERRRREEPAAKGRLRRHFLDTILRSKFALCLPGYGLNSFRFFEALSLGVPPILIADDCALPWEDLINYDRFCVRLPLQEPVAERLEDTLAGISDEFYREMCSLGRLHYDTYLSPRNFLFLLYRVLAAPLGKREAGFGEDRADGVDSGWFEAVAAGEG
jgi:hypothetical protein